MMRLSRLADAVAIGLAAVGLLALLVDGTLAEALFVAAFALRMVRPGMAIARKYRYRRDRMTDEAGI